jgi:hypothetical protein
LAKSPAQSRGLTECAPSRSWQDSSGGQQSRERACRVMQSSALRTSRSALNRVTDGSDLDRKKRMQLDGKELWQAVGHTVSPEPHDPPGSAAASSPWDQSGHAHRFVRTWPRGTPSGAPPGRHGSTPQDAIGTPRYPCATNASADGTVSSRLQTVALVTPFAEELVASIRAVDERPEVLYKPDPRPSTRFPSKHRRLDRSSRDAEAERRCQHLPGCAEVLFGIPDDAPVGRTAVPPQPPHPQLHERHRRWHRRAVKTAGLPPRSSSRWQACTRAA